MNVICSSAAQPLAIIDCGDAGWGDPTLSYAAIPLDMISYALEGYELEGTKAFGAFAVARLICDKLQDAMDRATIVYSLPVAAFRRFLQSKTCNTW